MRSFLNHSLLLGNSRWHYRAPSGKISHGFYSKKFKDFPKLKKGSQLCWASVQTTAMNKLFIRFAKQKNWLIKKIELQHLDLKTKYAPTLGIDRALNIIGARFRANRSFVVLDCGTAMTIDFYDAQRGHLGGWILPSAYLMSKSLHQNTAKLPKVVLKKSVKNKELGRSTQQAISNGIYLLLGELPKIIQDFEKKLKLKNPQRFLTGANLENLNLPGAKRVENLALEGLSWVSKNQRGKNLAQSI